MAPPGDRVEIAAIHATDHLGGFAPFEKREHGEFRQIEAALVHDLGLDAAFGQEVAAWNGGGKRAGRHGNLLPVEMDLTDRRAPRGQADVAAPEIVEILDDPPLSAARATLPQDLPEVEGRPVKRGMPFPFPVNDVGHVMSPPWMSGRGQAFAPVHQEMDDRPDPG